ncbi:hypothetical protein F0P96_03555 [Hymenobacter busanensis]|uniref:Uncharacterized protein n=1 Tax=Hymenobacter busanensis TaxID=2607656 RepID=A0A7L4ZTU2_9BACT|nr:DUF6794 domain-containing protein [Hymenobacter busanensis]KAA9339704.1 hypothetical protein F0P96_03555 [Hymenobacter busanensis]QHJ06541.1 hypothetical protein GUY19_04195 [Hymenobacter busanensis]
MTGSDWRGVFLPRAKPVPAAILAGLPVAGYCCGYGEAWGRKLVLVLYVPFNIFGVLAIRMFTAIFKSNMKALITTILVIYHLVTFGQTKEKPNVYELPIPKALNECYSLLDRTMPDDEILLIKTLPEDSIYCNQSFRNGIDFFHAWKLYDGSRLTQYFNKIGLHESYSIYNTILVSYHRYLNKKDVRLEEQIKQYHAIQRKEEQEFLAKVKKDTLNGIYVPKDLKDCFIQLDKMLSENSKVEIKSLESKEETIKYHHDLGMTLRNAWGLWGGSRLSKYFLDKKVNHPDTMSALILAFYYDWLHNNNEGWRKWVQ